MGKVVATDENDRVLGLMNREEVHAKGIWHRVSYPWVYNSHGEILFHRRSELKGENHGGLNLAYNGEHHSEIFENGGSLSPYRIPVLTALKEYGINPDEAFDISYLGKLKVEKSNRDKEHQGFFAVGYDGDISKLDFDRREIEKVWWGELEQIALGPLDDIRKRGIIIPIPDTNQQIQVYQYIQPYIEKIKSKIDREKFKDTA